MSKTQKGAAKTATPSRRSVIVRLLQWGKWTKDTLAKKLNEVNKAWAVARNKSAISGTLADLRKKPQQWAVIVDGKGVISVKVKAESESGTFLISDAPLGKSQQGGFVFIDRVPTTAEP